MKKYFMISIFCILIMLCACGKKTEQIAIIETPNDNQITIYRPGPNGIIADDELYQVKQPDSLSAAVEETMAAFTAVPYGSEYDSVVYHTYMLDVDNNLSLDFFAKQIPDTKTSLLANGALCQTLFQLSDLQNITIRILSENEEVIMENTFTRDSFYFYGNEDEHVNIRQLTIYYPNKEGNALTRGTVKVRQEKDKTIEEQIVSVLASRGVIPSNTTVNTIYCSSGVCYIDFGKTFMEGFPSTEGKLIIYSLVNSITEINGIDALYILVNGEPISNYHGFDDMNKALSFDGTIVK